MGNKGVRAERSNLAVENGRKQGENAFGYKIKIALSGES